MDALVLYTSGPARTLNRAHMAANLAPLQVAVIKERREKRQFEYISLLTKQENFQQEQQHLDS